MELWSKIRQQIISGELSLRQASVEYKLNFRTVQKIAKSPAPGAYTQSRPRAKPVLDPHLSFVHDILEQDRHAPPKQRHTAKRIFQRLRNERDYKGSISIVRAAVAAW